jgi:hypothetical protein
METTPEGFLLCRDVALARTGQQTYLAHEVPLTPDRAGRITVDREEDQVFRPETIESFRGKPFTNDHPAEDVSPENYRDHLIGVIQNPRRGTGDRSDFLIGDILVYDPKAIRDIRSGKREISCGYNADYERISPGRGRQVNIVGNHASLVREGRCGPACAITDAKGKSRGKVSRTKNFMDSMKRAFGAFQDADEEELSKSLQLAAKSLEATPEDPTTNTPGPVEEGENMGDEGGNHHHVTVNIGGMEAPRPSASASSNDSSEENPLSTVQDDDPDAGGGAGGGGDDDRPCTKADVIAAVRAAIAPILDRLEDLEGGSDPSDTETQDAVARAEIIVPGFKLPTFDARPGSQDQKKALHDFKKSVLVSAMSTRDGSALLSNIVGAARPDVAKMTPREVDILFRASSEHVRDRNNSGVRELTSAAYVLDDKGKKRVLDNKTWNEINRNFHKKAS